MRSRWPYILALLLTTSLATTSTVTIQPSSSLVPCLVSELIRLAGDFKPATAKYLEDIKDRYLEFATTAVKTVSNVGPLLKSEVKTNFAKLAPKKLKELQQVGLKHASDLHYVTSAAGLWSRGVLPDIIKGKVPYNFRQILGEKRSILFIGMIKRIEAGNLNSKITRDSIMRHLQTMLDELNAASVRALNPIDLKFVKVALMSSKSKTYIPFDILTSKKTHNEIVEYIYNFKQHYSKKVFSENEEKNRKIVEALNKYFKEAEKQLDDHVIGYQREIKAIDPKTGEYIADSESIGIGAGNIQEVLEQSGAAKKHGKKTVFFENLEVQSNLQELLGAHVRNDSNVTIVTIPQKVGYVGGNPVKVYREDGSYTVQLVEQYLLPKSVKDESELYNTGTLLFDMSSSRPTKVAFEEKMIGGRTVVRAISTLGDITHNNSTSIILGRGPDRQITDYENFKQWPDYFTNGEQFLKQTRKSWDSLLN